MKKVILFGASNLGQYAFGLLKQSSNIIGFADNDPTKWGNVFQGLPVYSPQFIFKNNVSVIITSSFSKEIAQQLQKELFFDYTIFNYQLQKPSLQSSSLVGNTLPIISMGDLLKDLKAPISINDLTFLSGGSSVMDYFFLKGIIEKCDFKTYLEIGTWTGESISAVAEIAETCYSVSLPDEHIGLEEVFRKYCNKANFSRYFSNGKSNIIHYKEDSHAFDYRKIKKQIDLVFIDGDHSYDGIKKDTEMIFDFVGYEDTIVVWHDFKTIRNQLVQTTFEAITSVLPVKYASNLFAVDTNICGVYIPTKLQKYFSFETDSESVYSYRVELCPKNNFL